MQASDISRDARIVIIGAGAGGLCMAWYLKAAGFKHVRVLERSPRLGGKCRSLTVGGQSFDLGANYITSAYTRVRELAARAGATMYTEKAGHVIDVVRSYLSQLFAERTTRHGVFMDILGLGVLLTGESGLGKSELGLELISRGHGLVADDAVDLYRVSQTALEGRCPDLLMNLLEVRGIGLLDIKAIFGETAVRRKMRLKLIVHLVRQATMDRDFERLPYEPLSEDILEVPVRKTVIAVDAGRNLAVLVEAAVRNTILQLRGIDTYAEFIERHHRAMGKAD